MGHINSFFYTHEFLWIVVAVPLHILEHFPCEAVNIYGASPSSGLQICDVADMYSSIRTVVCGSIRAIVCGTIGAVVCSSIRVVMYSSIRAVVWCY